MATFLDSKHSLKISVSGREIEDIQYMVSRLRAKRSNIRKKTLRSGVKLNQEKLVVLRRLSRQHHSKSNGAYNGAWSSHRMAYHFPDSIHGLQIAVMRHPQLVLVRVGVVVGTFVGVLDSEVPSSGQLKQEHQREECEQDSRHASGHKI